MEDIQQEEAQIRSMEQGYPPHKQALYWKLKGRLGALRKAWNIAEQLSERAEGDACAE